MRVSSPDATAAKATERAALVSVATGVAVLTLKAVAWRVTGSVALGSDALESIVNVVAALTMWAAVRYAARPADANHPFGHGKAEYLSAVLEGAMVLVAAGLILREAVPRLWHPTPARAFGEGMAWSLVASACNGALGWYLLRRGRALRSVALEADGRHVLTDVVTSAGVLAGFAAAKVTGWWTLDPLLAVLVALQIVRTGYGLMRRSVGGLMDETLDPAEAAALEALVSRVAREGGAAEVHGFRARHAGTKTFCEVHMVVPGGTTVEVAHRLCDAVERALAEAHPHAELTIHVEPPGA